MSDVFNGKRSSEIKIGLANVLVDRFLDGQSVLCIRGQFIEKWRFLQGSGGYDIR